MLGFPTRYFRIAVQTAVFALWVGLILSTHRPMDSWLATHVPVSLMLRIDPLVMTVVTGGMRVGVTILMLGFVTLAISLILGRVFCGWICPLGAIFDAYGWVLRRLRVRFQGPSPSWFSFKYYLLATILIFAILGGVSPLMGFDPIVLLTRTVAAVLMPLSRKHDQLTWVVGGAAGNNGNLIDVLTLILFLGTKILVCLHRKKRQKLNTQLLTDCRLDLLRGGYLRKPPGQDFTSFRKLAISPHLQLASGFLCVNSC